MERKVSAPYFHGECIMNEVSKENREYLCRVICFNKSHQQLSQVGVLLFTISPNTRWLTGLSLKYF